LYICVCIKQTPSSASVYVDPITGDVDYERFVQVLNPSDACAVEAAVRLKETLYSRGDPRGRPAIDDPRERELGNPRDHSETNDSPGSSDCTIKVITLGPEDAQGALRAALALGADGAVRLWNASAGEWGPFTVAAALAGYLKTEAILPDLVLCGDSSSDWSSGIVGPALAEQLALPQVTGVMQLGLRKRDEILRFTQNDKTRLVNSTGLTTNDIGLRNSHGDIDWPNEVTFQLTRRLEHGYRELLEAELPLLITVTSDLNEPHYPSLPAHMAALKAEIPVIDPQPLMNDYWLDETDEMTLLEIYAPRPLPRHIPAPDSRHSAYQRIGEIVAGGAIGRKTQLVQGTSEQLAKALVDFLKNRGFV
jgi:electron transfer flavoprotein beta subunit